MSHSQSLPNSGYLVSGRSSSPCPAQELFLVLTSSSLCEATSLYPITEGLSSSCLGRLDPWDQSLSSSLFTPRFEVAPCPEPRAGAQKSKVLGLSSHQQQEMERTEAKAKPLRMPINTFSGIIQ